MSRATVTIRSPDRAKAVAYLVNHLQGSPLMERLALPTSSLERGNFFLVTTSEPPRELDFLVSWGGNTIPPTNWLVQEIILHLSISSNSLVLLEDSNSSPNDPYLRTQEHPPIWSYQNTIYWPILKAEAPDKVEQVMAWAAGWRELITFTKRPTCWTAQLESVVLPEKAIQQMASSTTRLVTDVFDGEGFLVWELGTEKQLAEPEKGPEKGSGAFSQ